MNVAKLLWDAAAKAPKGALPVLSFPAVQKMGITVRELVESSVQQARAMKIVADEVPVLASVSLMDLSVEAQAFGANVRFSAHEVPTITRPACDRRGCRRGAGRSQRGRRPHRYMCGGHPAGQAADHRPPRAGRRHRSLFAGRPSVRCDGDHVSVL